MAIVRKSKPLAFECTINTLIYSQHQKKAELPYRGSAFFGIHTYRLLALNYQLLAIISVVFLILTNDINVAWV